MFFSTIYEKNQLYSTPVKDEGTFAVAKKFDYLILVKPNAAIFGKQGNGVFAIGGVIYD